MVIYTKLSKAFSYVKIWLKPNNKGDLNMSEDKNCNCDHDHDELNDTITLTLDDDTVLECDVIGVFEVEDKEYIALLPKSEEEEDVFLYGYKELSDGEIELINIDDDDEFEKVSETFSAIMDEEDFDDEDEE